MDSSRPPDDDELLDDLEDSLDDPPPKDAQGSFTGRFMGDIARKAIMTGIGAVFMSEETLRNTLSEMKLPKEAMKSVVSGADRTKRELIAALSREMRSFLNSLELEKVLAKALAGTTFDIHTRVKIMPGEGGHMSLQVVDTKTQVTREKQDDDELGDDAAEEESKPKRRGRAKKKSDADDE